MAKNEDAIERMEDAKDLVIGAISETMDLYGITPAAGKLYATMYFEGEMNLDEMEEKLGMSKPSMSTSVRRLQEINMVNRRFPRGSRKHTYVAEKNFFQFFISFYCQMWDREVKINLDAIKEAEGKFLEIINDPAISDEIKVEAQEHYELITRSKDFYYWLEKLVKSIRSEELFDFLPVDSDDKNPSN